jgi:acylphosphatase
MSEGLRLGLVGWVRNLPGGSVEAHIQGDEPAVDALVAWLGEGPIGSTVRRCVVHPALVEAELTSFEIRA